MKNGRNWINTWWGVALQMFLGIMCAIGFLVTLNITVGGINFLANKYVESLPAYKDLRISKHNSYARYETLADKLYELETKVECNNNDSKVNWLYENHTKCSICEKIFHTDQMKHIPDYVTYFWNFDIKDWVSTVTDVAPYYCPECYSKMERKNELDETLST